MLVVVPELVQIIKLPVCGKRETVRMVSLAIHVVTKLNVLVVQLQKVATPVRVGLVLYMGVPIQKLVTMMLVPIQMMGTVSMKSIVWANVVDRLQKIV
jgi:hypothetical protein